MPLELTWTDTDDPRVAAARARAYRVTDADRRALAADRDPRAQAGDAVLALDGTKPAATATALSMDIVIRGRRLPAQGVAWVGTDKTHRRTGGAGAGAATQVMNAVLAKAREREQIVSALMPFRVSFYERFGYGVAERRARWRVPTNVLPRGDFGGLRYATPDDEASIADCRHSEAEAGHGDCHFGDRGVAHWQNQSDKKGLTFVDERDGRVDGYACLEIHGYHAPSDVTLPVHHWATPESFRRQLHWLASLRDQHGRAEFHLPVDLPLDALLRERQLPHRPVIHETALCRTYTRMQCRILDHVAFCDGLTLPTARRGTAVVRIVECDGDPITLRLDLDAGQLSAAASDATPDAVLRDVDWATIAFGAGRASELARLKVIDCDTETAGLLDAFADGPAPWCNEYF